jgi:hypothetical protein
MLDAPDAGCSWIRYHAWRKVDFEILCVTVDPHTDRRESSARHAFFFFGGEVGSTRKLFFFFGNHVVEGDSRRQRIWVGPRFGGRRVIGVFERAFE